MSKKIVSTLLIVFCFISVFFISCEKDTFEEKVNPTEVVSSILTGEEARIVFLRLEEKIKESVALRAANRSVVTPLGEIHFDEVMKVTNPNGWISYSFEMIKSDSEITSVYNITLLEKDDKAKVKVYEFKFSPEFSVLYNKNKNLKDFDGTLKTPP